MKTLHAPDTLAASLQPFADMTGLSLPLLLLALGALGAALLSRALVRQMF